MSDIVYQLKKKAIPGTITINLYEGSAEYSVSKKNGIEIIARDPFRPGNILGYRSLAAQYKNIMNKNSVRHGAIEEGTDSKLVMRILIRA